MSSHKKLEKRKERSTRSVSVVVPCAHTHAAHVPGLVAALRAQTRPPEQIVVAISGCAVSALPPLGSDVMVVHSLDPRTAGANRNLGAAAARGDIVLYQDADDVPHPQRVEIVAALFEKYEIEHLMHFYDRSEDHQAFVLKKALKRGWYRTSAVVGGVTNGNPAAARSLLEVVRWPEHARIGEDLEFNAAALKHTRRCAVVELPLLTYRQHLSSFGWPERTH